MTLDELYEEVGGNYLDVLDRLDDKETVECFVIRFLDDTSYTQLLKHLQKHNLKGAFYAGHTLKGISKSLGFCRLGDCVAGVCDDLRCGNAPSEVAIQQLKTEYNCVIAAINSFKKSL